MIIAVDGLAASGKGTLAAGLSELLGLPRLDTGLLYRAAALACIDAGIGPGDEAACAALAAEADIDSHAPERLTSPEAAHVASDIGALAAVRSALFGRQRAFAERPGGAILDGRDIGTVIAPDAAIKFWLYADLGIRSRRRWLQSREENRPSLAVITEQLSSRDATDTGRRHAAARPAEDAVMIDTTKLDQSAVLSVAMKIIKDKGG